MVGARRQRLKELLAARDRLDAQIVALGGIPRPAPMIPARSPAQHGTDSGYYAHRRGYRGWPEDPCTACRRAHSEANRKRSQQAVEKSVHKDPGLSPVNPQTRDGNPQPEQARDLGLCDNGENNKAGPGDASDAPGALANQGRGPLMTYPPSYPSAAV